MLDKGHSGTAINNSYLLSSLLLLSDKKGFCAKTRGDILENCFGTTSKYICLEMEIYTGLKLSSTRFIRDVIISQTTEYKI